MNASDVQTVLPATLTCLAISITPVLLLRLAQGWPPISLRWPQAWPAGALASLVIILFVSEELLEAEARHGGHLAFIAAFVLAAGTLLLALIGWLVAYGHLPRGGSLATALIALAVAALLAYSFSTIDVPAIIEKFTDSIPT